MDLQFKDLPASKRIYIASDFHLGCPNHTESRNRENLIIDWLSTIEKNAAAVILLGDTFDFWYEYKQAVPKGFVRFLGKIANIADRNIPVLFFTGNHDLWMFDYLPTELGTPVYRSPQSFQIGKNTYFIGHGDGLDATEHTYKFFKKIFTNSFAQWCYRWLHPDLGVSFGKWWSALSRSQDKEEKFKGEEEGLWKFCKEKEKSEHYDYYVFGHRHLPLELPVNNNSKYFNLGEWFSGHHYLEIDCEKACLKKFQKK